MVLTITDEQIVLDGRVYRLEENPDEEKVGREYVAQCLGCTVNNTYQRPWFLPDFGNALKTEKRPYKKSDVREWLAIPLPKRKELYKEYLKNEGN